MPGVQSIRVERIEKLAFPGRSLYTILMYPTVVARYTVTTGELVYPPLWYIHICGTWNLNYADALSVCLSVRVYLPISKDADTDILMQGSSGEK